MKSHKKLDDFDILASVPAKTTNKAQQPPPTIYFILNYIFEISGFH